MTKAVGLTSEISIATSLRFIIELYKHSQSSHTTSKYLLSKDELRQMVICAHEFGQLVAKNVAGLVSPQDILKYCNAKMKLDMNQSVELSKLFSPGVELQWDLQINSNYHEGFINPINLETNLFMLAREVKAEWKTAILLQVPSVAIQKVETIVCWYESSKYLMYICPSRVKIVSTLHDFIRKLSHELPSCDFTQTEATTWILKPVVRNLNNPDTYNIDLDVFDESKNIKQFEDDEIGSTNISDVYQPVTCTVTNTVSSDKLKDNLLVEDTGIEKVDNNVLSFSSNKVETSQDTNIIETIDNDDKLKSPQLTEPISQRRTIRPYLYIPSTERSIFTFTRKPNAPSTPLISNSPISLPTGRSENEKFSTKVSSVTPALEKIRKDIHDAIKARDTGQHHLVLDSVNDKRNDTCENVSILVTHEPSAIMTDISVELRPDESPTLPCENVEKVATKANRSACERYKCKLGKAAWWELEYQAQRFFREGNQTCNMRRSMNSYGMPIEKKVVQLQKDKHHSCPDSDSQVAKLKTTPTTDASTMTTELCLNHAEHDTRSNQKEDKLRLPSRYSPHNNQDIIPIASTACATYQSDSQSSKLYEVSVKEQAGKNPLSSIIPKQNKSVSIRKSLEHPNISMHNDINTLDERVIDTNNNFSSNLVPLERYDEEPIKGVIANDCFNIPFHLQGRVPLRKKVLSTSNQEDTSALNISNYDIIRSPLINSQRSNCAQETILITAGSDSSENNSIVKVLRDRKLAQLEKQRQYMLENNKKHKQNLLSEKNSKIMNGVEGSLIKVERRIGDQVGKKPSNKQLIQNALQFTLLAGASTENELREALSAMAESQAMNFVVLLKSRSALLFRGLYEHHVTSSELHRIYSLSNFSTPRIITATMVGTFFRYNSGKKYFSIVETKSFTWKTDGCSLKAENNGKKKLVVESIL